MATVAAASPMGQLVDTDPSISMHVGDFPFPDIETDPVKRDVKISVGNFPFPDDENALGEGKAGGLRRRAEDEVICARGGGVWAPVTGFISAINTFCNKADGWTVPYDGSGEKPLWGQVNNVNVTYPEEGKKYSFYGNSGARRMKEYNAADNDAAGIYNTKIKEGHALTKDDCPGTLEKLTDVKYGHYCFGRQNKDTKGGKIEAADVGNWIAYVKERRE
ncbi:hypothetical protein MPH_08521 [Macrophomina phaseolina MS6]|uniref:Uncharacterized protein n=1 Tax=Macrophomina phaseolina (strain MS6) TaxID=1126212 RepID=K2QWV2_MACPH|nr:hypothetical protein MPH_08521 [Macrophomina phaseolina MS6]